MPADVSVVIPTRNRLPLLAQTLHSVLAQPVDLEVIVVDEGSSDGTEGWLASLPTSQLTTIRHARPQGLPAARNAGLARATGTWVAFVDDDDLWLPDKLETQLAAAAQQGAPWVYGGSLDVTGEPRLLRITVPRPDDAKRLPWVNVVPGGGSNAIARRELVRTAGTFDTSLPTAEDWDMWIRLGQLAPPAVVPRPVMAYRMHPGNMSKKVDAMLRGIEQIDHRYRDVRGGEPLDWEDTYRWLGADALRSGDRRAARRLALAALRSRHPGALRRLLRSVAPVRPRTPVPVPGDHLTWHERIRPSPVVAWPPGIEAWLRASLRVEAS